MSDEEYKTQNIRCPNCQSLFFKAVNQLKGEFRCKICNTFCLMNISHPKINESGEVDVIENVEEFSADFPKGYWDDLQKELEEND